MEYLIIGVLIIGAYTAGKHRALIEAKPRIKALRKSVAALESTLEEISAHMKILQAAVDSLSDSGACNGDS